MPLDLHPGCKRRLIEVVTEGLSTINTKHGMFLDRMSVLRSLYKTEQSIPDKGPLRNQLEAYIGDFPVVDFVGELLSIELHEADQYLIDTPSIELGSLEGYRNPETKARSLIEQLESLPWRYTLSIQLPKKISDILNGLFDIFELSDNIRIVASKANLDEVFPLASDDQNRHKRIHGAGGLLSGLIEPQWEEHPAYLQVDVDGFVGMYGSTMTVVRAKEVIRSVCGLAIGIQLLNVGHEFRLLPTKPNFYVHKHTESGRKIDGKFAFEDLYASAFEDLEIHDLDGRLKNDEHKRRWAADRLTDIRTALSAGKRADRILLASQWLFDSYAVKDELLSFVQTMVVLEILLGEQDSSDEIGLGQLLRNRCAYLIGATHSQRAKILRDFNRIYAVRSHIVHRGKSRLTLDERLLFNQLRWMCRRVIQEELRLLKADTAES